MENSDQQQKSRAAKSERSKAVLPGGFHSRGLPGEEGDLRRHMRVVKIGDQSQRIFTSQPSKGAVGAEQASAAQLVNAVREANWAATARRDAERSDHAEGNESTVAYVITKKGISVLDTPVFHAGDAGEEEAVALFTARQAAQGYIDQAGWSESDEIGELGLSDLREWLLEANDEGIHYATVNPNRQRHLVGDSQPVLSLDALRGESADSLLQAVTEIAHEQVNSTHRN